MTKIRINNYILESPKLDKSKNIINISDIHSNIEVLKKIRKILPNKLANVSRGDIIKL